MEEHGRYGTIQHSENTAIFDLDSNLQKNADNLNDMCCKRQYRRFKLIYHMRQALAAKLVVTISLISCSGSQFSSTDGTKKKFRLGQGAAETGEIQNTGTIDGTRDDNAGKTTDNVGTDSKQPSADQSSTPSPETTTPSPCVSQAPNTVVSADGFLQYTNTNLKPGEFGQPSATLGMDWPNGGTNDKYGVAPATVDWRLCPKIAFVEHGHSLTRTISFKSLDADGDVTLRIHRARFATESDGIGIWYHWAKNIEWKSGSLFNFQAQKDYDVTCSFVKNTDKWLCDYKASAPTALDCKMYKSSECTNYALKP